MSFSLQILGSSAAVPTKERKLSAHVLNVRERLFLIDCGEATQMQMRSYGVKFQRIQHVFISHLHADHYLGLIGFLSTLNLLGREKTMYLYADARLEGILQQHFSVSDTVLRYPLVFHPLQENTSECLLENESLSVHSFPLKHRIPCWGFVFKEKAFPLNLDKKLLEKYDIPHEKMEEIKQGKDYYTPEGICIPNNKLVLAPKKAYSFAYCSDTAYDESIIPYIKEVDLLMHEASFTKELQRLAEEKMHSTSLDAAKIALKAEVGKLILTHFSARYKDTSIILQQAKEIFDNTILGEEGKIIRCR